MGVFIYMALCREEKKQGEHLLLYISTTSINEQALLLYSVIIAYLFTWYDIRVKEHIFCYFKEEKKPLFMLSM